MVVMIKLNMISWIAEGLTNINTLNRIRELVKVHNLSFVCLVETRAVKQ